MSNVFPGQKVSALEARRAADRVVFGDLVGCTLSSGDAKWIPEPEPRWRVPYHLFDGTLLAEVEVDARTQAVLLTEDERTDLLEQVERSVVSRTTNPVMKTAPAPAATTR